MATTTTSLACLRMHVSPMWVQRTCRRSNKIKEVTPTNRFSAPFRWPRNTSFVAADTMFVCSSARRPKRGVRADQHRWPDEIQKSTATDISLYPPLCVPRVVRLWRRGRGQRRLG